MSNSATTRNLPKTHTHHSVLIGFPLVIVLAFAFGFVLLQPVHSTNSGLASASQTAQAAASKTSDKTSSATAIVPIPLPAANLPTLTPAPVNNDSSLDGTSDGATITTPQSAAGSASPASLPASASSGLQAAVPNHQITSTQSIRARSSSPGSILTNLFNRFW